MLILLEQNIGNARAEKSCMNLIFTSTRSWSKRLPPIALAQLLFVNLRKAYETVSLQLLWEESTSINATITNPIKQLYHETQAKIKLNTDFSKDF